MDEFHQVRASTIYKIEKCKNIVFLSFNLICISIMNICTIESTLSTAFKAYELFKNILNSYVSDFYLAEHWKNLPDKWQSEFLDVTTQQLSEILNFKQPLANKIYPLSFLSLRQLIATYSLRREQSERPKTSCALSDSDPFMKLFWKGVKLKKRHEISIMAEYCYELSLKTGCSHIVDIGSGLGHLSRMLSFGYGLNVCTFEADTTLSKLANELDDNFESLLNYRKVSHRRTFNTIHVNKKITKDLLAATFSLIVQDIFKNYDGFKFGIVGLHPCGDLGTSLLKYFSESPNVAFICMASCCYMKLSLSPFEGSPSFPLSKYCSENDLQLSYLSCEIACHAIENYIDRLKNPEEYNKLKIHSYRAVLEKILVSDNPKLKHAMVCNVKWKPDLSFEKYCTKVLQKLNIVVPHDEIVAYTELIDRTWQRVVVFFSLRLLLAPLVETIILLDRLLYLKDCDCVCDIVPAFDSSISPRNQIILAYKR